LAAGFSIRFVAGTGRAATFRAVDFSAFVGFAFAGFTRVRSDLGDFPFGRGGFAFARSGFEAARAAGFTAFARLAVGDAFAGRRAGFFGRFWARVGMGRAIVAVRSGVLAFRLGMSESPPVMGTPGARRARGDGYNPALRTASSAGP
jgi:hypothetical protein